MKYFASLIGGAMALTVGAAAQAASVTLDFPEAGTVYVSAANGSGTIPAGGQSAYLYTSGDHVVDFYAATGLASATSLSATFTIQNYLNVDQFFDVLVNGVDVGTYDVAPDGESGDYQTLSFTESFAAIAGPDYGLEYVLDNTIPPGAGSIAFTDGGTVTLSGAVPEPAAWALMLVGFGALGVTLRRARRGTVAA